MSETMREAMHRHARKQVQQKIEWRDGERERLIAEALEAGKVTRCPPGYAIGAHDLLRMGRTAGALNVMGVGA